MSFIDLTFGLNDPETGYGVFGVIYALLVLLPGIAVGIRRMHDVGKSGWFILFPIYNIVLAATPGIEGVNEYGSDPKNEENNSTDNISN